MRVSQLSQVSDWIEPYIKPYRDLPLQLRGICTGEKRTHIYKQLEEYEMLFDLVLLGATPAPTPAKTWCIYVPKCVTFPGTATPRTTFQINCYFGLPNKDSYVKKAFLGFMPPLVYLKYLQAARVIGRHNVVIVASSLSNCNLLAYAPDLPIETSWFFLSAWDATQVPEGTTGLRLKLAIFYNSLILALRDLNAIWTAPDVD